MGKGGEERYFPGTQNLLGFHPNEQLHPLITYSFVLEGWMGVWTASPSREASCKGRQLRDLRVQGAASGGIWVLRGVRVLAERKSVFPACALGREPVLPSGPLNSGS